MNIQPRFLITPVVYFICYPRFCGHMRFFINRMYSVVYFYPLSVILPFMWGNGAERKLLIWLKGFQDQYCPRCRRLRRPLQRTHSITVLRLKNTFYLSTRTVEDVDSCAGRCWRVRCPRVRHTHYPQCRHQRICNPLLRVRGLELSVRPQPLTVYDVLIIHIVGTVGTTTIQVSGFRTQDQAYTLNRVRHTHYPHCRYQRIWNPPCVRARLYVYICIYIQVGRQ